MNKNNNTLLCIASIIAMTAIIMLVSLHKKDPRVIALSDTPQSTPQESSTTPVTSASHETLNTGTTKISGTTTTPIGTSSYTSSQVAMHKNRSDCWTSINDSVYDVTPWITQHPGGQQAIISLCGIDGSAAFNGQHGGQSRPASELASFNIGALAQ